MAGWWERAASHVRPREWNETTQFGLRNAKCNKISRKRLKNTNAIWRDSAFLNLWRSVNACNTTTVICQLAVFFLYFAEDWFCIAQVQSSEIRSRSLDVSHGKVNSQEVFNGKHSASKIWNLSRRCNRIVSASYVYTAAYPSERFFYEKFLFIRLTDLATEFFWVSQKKEKARKAHQVCWSNKTDCLTKEYPEKVVTL